MQHKQCQIETEKIGADEILKKTNKIKK